VEKQAAFVYVSSDISKELMSHFRALHDSIYLQSNGSQRIHKEGRWELLEVGMKLKEGNFMN
jgi:hypothetical protein